MCPVFSTFLIGTLFFMSCYLPARIWKFSKNTQTRTIRITRFLQQNREYLAKKKSIDVRSGARGGQLSRLSRNSVCFLRQGAFWVRQSTRWDFQPPYIKIGQMAFNPNHLQPEEDDWYIKNTWTQSDSPECIPVMYFHNSCFSAGLMFAGRYHPQQARFRLIFGWRIKPPDQ